MRSIELPSIEDMPDFNPNDPFDAAAERYRKIVVDAFLDSGQMISMEEVEAAMYGMLVGVVGVAASCVKPEGHKDLLKAFIAYMPFAMDTVRAIQGHGPLPKDQ